jgi:hypothetical protein
MVAGRTGLVTGHEAPSAENQDQEVKREEVRM